MTSKTAQKSQTRKENTTTEHPSEVMLFYLFISITQTGRNLLPFISLCCAAPHLEHGQHMERKTPRGAAKNQIHTNLDRHKRGLENFLNVLCHPPLWWATCRKVHLDKLLPHLGEIMMLAHIYTCQTLTLNNDNLNETDL